MADIVLTINASGNLDEHLTKINKKLAETAATSKRIDVNFSSAFSSFSKQVSSTIQTLNRFAATGGILVSAWTNLNAYFDRRREQQISASMRAFEKEQRQQLTQYLPQVSLQLAGVSATRAQEIASEMASVKGPLADSIRSSFSRYVSEIATLGLDTLDEAATRAWKDFRRFGYLPGFLEAYTAFTKSRKPFSIEQVLGVVSRLQRFTDADQEALLSAIARGEFSGSRLLGVGDVFERFNKLGGLRYRLSPERLQIGYMFGQPAYLTEGLLDAALPQLPEILTKSAEEQLEELQKTTPEPTILEKLTDKQYFTERVFPEAAGTILGGSLLSLGAGILWKIFSKRRFAQDFNKWRKIRQSKRPEDLAEKAQIEKTWGRRKLEEVLEETGGKALGLSLIARFLGATSGAAAAIGAGVALAEAREAAMPEAPAVGISEVLSQSLAPPAQGSAAAAAAQIQLHHNALREITTRLDRIYQVLSNPNQMLPRVP